jgi:hypothetical protein
MLFIETLIFVALTTKIDKTKLKGRNKKGDKIK